MNINRFLKLGSLALSLVVLSVFGLSAVSAGAAPRAVIAGAPAPGNYCSGGTLSFPVHEMIDGGYAFIRVKAETNGSTARTHGWSNYNYSHQTLDRTINYQVYLGYEMPLAANTILFVTVQTSQNNVRNVVYESRMGINCSTGAVTSMEEGANLPALPRLLPSNLDVPILQQPIVLPGAPQGGIVGTTALHAVQLPQP